MNRHRNFVTVLTLLVALASAAGLSAAGPARAKVNINTASLEQLALLPRVGPAVAQRIVTFREENGEFKAAADLMLVKGIGDKTYALIAPYVAIAGETTLTAKVSSSRQSSASTAAEAGEPKD